MQTPQDPYNQPPIANAVGGAPYNGPTTGQNNSGTGSAAVLPPELRGLNWGAFLMSWIWAIAHSTWIGLLCFCIPFMPLVLLIKGNEYAWQNRRWDSVEQFQAVQKKWATWGIAILVAGMALGVVGGLLGGIAASRLPSSTTTTTTLPANPSTP